jgi:hypothetical protein
MHIRETPCRQILISKIALVIFICAVDSIFNFLQKIFSGICCYKVKAKNSLNLKY